MENNPFKIPISKSLITKNLVERDREIAIDFCNMNGFMENPLVEGIVFLSGIGGHDFTDEFSDIDISLFISEDSKDLPPFELHHQGRLINIFRVNIAADPKFSDSAKFAYSNSSIFFY